MPFCRRCGEFFFKKQGKFQKVCEKCLKQHNPNVYAKLYKHRPTPYVYWYQTRFRGIKAVKDVTNS